MFVTFRFLHVGFISASISVCLLESGVVAQTTSTLISVGAPPQPAPVAQWIEPPFPRRLVAGSNPARGTRLTLRC